MKLADIVKIYPALRALAEEKLPARTALRVGRALTLLEKDYALYETTRNAKLQEYGTPDPAGPNAQGIVGFSFSTKEALDNFAAEIQKMDEEEVNVTLPTITEDDLGNVAIEAKYLQVLDGVFIV